MLRSRFVRRLLLICVLGAIFTAAVVGFVRARLLTYGLTSVLVARGATDVRFDVVRAAPWQVAIADFGFSLAADRFAAKRVTLERSRWWFPSLGTLRIEGAQASVDTVALAAAPEKKPEDDQAKPNLAVDLPFEEVALDGTLILRAKDLGEVPLSVRFEAHAVANHVWEARATVTGDAMGGEWTASFSPEKETVVVQGSGLKLDLAAWQKWLDGLAPSVMAGAKVSGSITGETKLRHEKGAWAGSGAFKLRDGSITLASGLKGEGIDGDAEFVDLLGLKSAPAVWRMREANVGKVAVRNIAMELSLGGSDQFVVTKLTGDTLGGVVRVEPFTFVPSGRAVDLTLVVDGVNASEVLALTDKLPAQASGQVSGRLPLHIDDAGFKFGTGWMGLRPGTSAQIQINAAGLLTAGASPKSPSYAVLQRIESGLLKLEVNELRLDIRPPGSPASRSAQLRVSGRPVDRSIQAPVELDLNVNGPLESLLNLGLKANVGIGTKP